MSASTPMQPLPSQHPPAAEGPAYRLWKLWRHGERPDVRGFLASLAELPPPDVAAVLRVDQRERWLAGEPISAETYLQEFFSPDGPADHALDLVYGEFLLREELGEAPAADEYAERFPRFAEEFRMQVALHQALRSRSAATPGREERSLQDCLTVHQGAGRRPTADRPHVPGYDVVAVLGQGGMGIVYKAWQVGLKRLVALKMLRRGDLHDPEQLARFRAESEAVAQLQHPNIVQIHEVGEQDGHPFFSMEFVEGGSLDRWLAGTPQPAREAAGLVETLARAMHAAHRRGIVHRDLKPANVLLSRRASSLACPLRVGKQGCLPYECEPKITDFGLAKRLDEEAGATRSGDILGTPSYMAPEQAGGRSKEAGPAVDVYALGAILYELLTGRPPFRGATPLETLDQVRSAEAVPPRQLQPKLPRDLETICLKCLQKEPHRRYATAEDLADDLGRFLHSEPIRARPVGAPERLARWCRRNPRVAVLSGALVVAVLTGLAWVTGLYLHADELRARAEANFEEARKNLEEANRQHERAELHLGDCYNAVDVYYTRVSEERLLRQPDMEELRKDLLQSALKFYERFVALSGKDPRFQAERGRAYGRLAGITREIDSRAKAIPLVLEARDIFERLLRDDPGAPEYLHHLAVTHEALGNLHRESGQHDVAEKALSKATKILVPLARSHPKRPLYRADLANAENSLAILYAGTGRPRLAEQAYRKALDELKALADDHPKDTYRHRLALCCNGLGLFYRDQSRTEESAKAFKKAVDIQVKLTQTSKHVPAYRASLALTYVNLGLLRRDTGQLDLAEKAYGEAADLFEGLTRDHPRVIDHQEDLALSYSNLGVVYRDTGRLDRAEQAFVRAEGVRAALVNAHPKIPDCRRALAESHNNLAAVYHDTGRFPEAEAAYRKSLAALEQLVNDHPEVPQYANLLARTRGSAGGVYLHTGRPKEAWDHFRQGTETITRLIKDHSGIPDYQHTLGLLEHNKGIWHLEMGEFGSAEQAFERAAAALEPLRLKHPRMTEYRDLLAGVRGALAKVYRQTKGNEKAEAAFNAALDLRQKLDHDHGGAPQHRDALAEAYNELGSFYAGTRQAAKAEEAYGKAFQIRKGLVDKHPKATAFATGLGGVCCNLGHVASGKERSEKAREWYDQSIQVLAAPARDAKNTQARLFLGNAHAGRAGAFLKLDRPKDAVVDLDRVLELKTGPEVHNVRFLRAMTLLKLKAHARVAADAAVLAQVKPIAPRNLYALAALYALANEAAQQDEALTPEDKGQVSESYAAESIKLLRRAHAAGAFPTLTVRANVRRNRDLRSLQGRADFKAFLDELGQGAQ